MSTLTDMERVRGPSLRDSETALGITLLPISSGAAAAAAAAIVTRPGDVYLLEEEKTSGDRETGKAKDLLIQELNRLMMMMMSTATPTTYCTYVGRLVVVVVIVRPLTSGFYQTLELGF